MTTTKTTCRDCRVEQRGVQMDPYQVIVFCPLHAAADDLAEALRDIMSRECLYPPTCNIVNHRGAWAALTKAGVK